MHMSELLATLRGAGLHRARGPGRQQADCAGQRAPSSGRLRTRCSGLGFSLIEVLSPCPTIWKMNAGGRAALGARRDGEDLSAGRVLRSHQRGAAAAAAAARAIARRRFRGILGVDRESLPEGNAHAHGAVAADLDLRVRVAGFGGQGVLLLGEVLAEAGLDAGLEVSWLPSYGPEIRSGTSNCHVRLSSQTIDSPLVTAPDVLVAMNEPSLRKFDANVRPGGWVHLQRRRRSRRIASARMCMCWRFRSRRLPTNWATRARATWSCWARCLRSPSVLPDASIDAALAPSGQESAMGWRSTSAHLARGGNSSRSRWPRCDMQADADPNLIVYFDGQYVPLREARVGILTHALHYGTGVFEGIRAHWDEAQQELFVMRPMEHYERWKQNCGILRIAVPLSPEELCAITAGLMRRNDFRTNVYVRPLAYKSAERVGVSPDDQDAFAIVALPFGDYLHADNGLACRRQFLAAH